MNDWDLRSFLYTIIIWTLISLALVKFDDIGIHIPYLRQFVVGAYMIFAPGISFLKVFGVRGRNSIITFLFTIGTGITILMFLGLVLNTLYLLFDWTGVFNVWGTLIAVVLFVTTSCILVRMKNFKEDDVPKLDIAHFISTPAIILFSIPLISVVSTFILNRNNNGFMQIVLLVIIMGGMIWVCWKRLVPEPLIPLAIVSFSTALLWHTSLISYGLVEWADVSFEYWSAVRPTIVGFWDSNLPSRTNSLLSLTVFVPMISIPSGIEPLTFFKVAFPLLFSLVPLGVYCLARRCLEPRLAMVSVFFVISSSCFFTEMLGLNRQIVAELFMLLIVIALLDAKIENRKKMLLLTIFSLSLAVSHYGLLMIFVICAGAGMLITVSSTIFSRKRPGLIGLLTICIGMLLAIGLWFFLIADSYISKIMFDAFTQIFRGIAELRGTESSTILSIYKLDQLTALGLASAVFYYLILALIIIGIVQRTFVLKNRKPFEGEHLALSLAFLLVMASGAFSPDVFGYVSEARLAHISMLILAPFIVIGGGVIVERIRIIVKKASGKDIQPHTPVVMAVFSVLLLMVSSGLVGFVVGEQHSFELDTNSVPRPNFNQMEINAAEWSFSRIGVEERIRADAHQAYLVNMYTGTHWPLYTTNGRDVYSALPHKTYYFYGTENVNGYLWLEDPDNFRINNTKAPITQAFSNFMFKQCMVYNAHYSVVYYDNDE